MKIRNRKVQTMTETLIKELEDNDLVQQVKRRVANDNPELMVYRDVIKSERKTLEMKALAKHFFDISFAFMVNYIRTYEFAICTMMGIPPEYTKQLVIPGTLAPMDPRLFSRKLREKIHQEQLSKMEKVNNVISSSFDTESVKDD